MLIFIFSFFFIIVYYVHVCSRFADWYYFIFVTFSVLLWLHFGSTDFSSGISLGIYFIWSAYGYIVSWLVLFVTYFTFTYLVGSFVAYCLLLYSLILPLIPVRLICFLSIFLSLNMVIIYSFLKFFCFHFICLLVQQ